MAFLDHEVPTEAKNLTIDLLQKCVGRVCCVKYHRSMHGETKTHVACGMVSSVSFSAERSIETAQVVLYESPNNGDSIEGKELEYIYSLSMLPGRSFTDALDFIC